MFGWTYQQGLVHGFDALSYIGIQLIKYIDYNNTPQNSHY